ncbi:transglutaminase TgpA family protein [Arenimonas sp. MALMAid1274]|uniref:transglutaminase TgpA family protein n=1 Tax=Arenimonas sp. MALMAid1274 TaxID=3411630 RepID=UPI003BA1FECE
MAEVLPRRVRLLSLAAAGACLLPLLLQLPTGLAWGLVAVAAVGVSAARQWPVFSRLTLLALLGSYVLVSHGFSLGRDTGCAMLATLLALKPFETHRLRDARSLLGFSLFAPFAAFLQDQGPLVLALALPAMALWLLALAVLAEQVPGAPPTRVDRGRARDIALAVTLAVPLALAGFWLFPRLGSPMWGLPENALGRSGLSDRMTPDEWVELFADDAPVLRARFTARQPRSDDLYWRAQVLTWFDGRTWSRGAEPAQAAPERRFEAADVLDYEVTMEPTDLRYLVTLDQPVAAPEGGQLAHDLTVSTPAPVVALVRYSGRSVSNARQVFPLAPEEERAALSLPRDLNPRMRALALQWRNEAAGDDVAVVRRALAWIGEDFSYSLTVPPSGRHAVDDFLFDTRVGFCQHYSSAFTNLMRAAGIPSRVVVGYAGGYRNPYGEYWVVRKMDAHAWSEVWLRGRGWIRVDPTAAVAPERVLDTVQDLARAEALLPDAFTPLRDFGDWARRGWNDMVLGFNAARQASLLRPLGIEQASAGQLAAAFAIGAGLALVLTLAILMRGRPRSRDPLERAWQLFTRRLRRVGLAKAPSEAPLSFGERVASALPAQADQVRALSRRYAAWRYAGVPLDARAKAALASELRAYRPGKPQPANTAPAGVSP